MCFAGLIVSVKKKSEEKIETLLAQKNDLQEQVNQLELKVSAQKVVILYFVSSNKFTILRENTVPFTKTLMHDLM